MINSVLGFDLKAEIVDKEGQVLKTGCRSCIIPKEKGIINSKILDKKFFTTFNEPLLAKIRNLRQNL
jgi:hypothetical protein